MSTQPNSLRNSESEFLRHTPCPTCGSSDANSVYSDGHSFCFACNTYTHPDSSVRSMSVSAVSLEGYAQRLNKRKISESTCQRYNIRRDGDRLRFYYYSADGRVVGCKTKTKDKNFSYEGQTEGTFFGQHLWPSQGKMVVITEGGARLCKRLSSSPDVARCFFLPNGSAAAKKSIKTNLEWLQGYQKIVLLFDNDEAGRNAAKEAASVLPPGKVFISFFDQYKDASDALQADDLAAITRAVWDAKPYRPDGIVDGKSLLELVTTPNPPNDYEYGFEGLNRLLHGIRFEESLSQLLQDLAREVILVQQLATFYKAGGRVGYLVSKNQTDEQLWV